MKTLCTIAAVAIAFFTLSGAFADPNPAKVDDTITGSITPASYGLKYRPDVKGY